MMVECIWGAVRDMASNYAGGREASELCEQAPAAMRARCFEGIGTILGDLHQTAGEIRAACAEITRRYRARVLARRRHLGGLVQLAGRSPIQ